MELAVPNGLSAVQKRVRLALFLAWLALLLVLASRHVFWRDEVRAFSIALAGDGIGGMLRGLHGEGHPALWYLLLRGVHALVPVREVLPAVAALVAAGAMALLAFRSPFKAGLIALILFGQFGLFEYAVTARNYGISMLLLFAIAALYPRWRDRGVTIGALLFLLCNTNVPSALLAAAFCLFWLIEITAEEGLRWTRKHSLFALNAALAALGALACFLTVFPTVHDAAVVQHPGGITLRTVASAILFPAESFPNLAPDLFAGSAAMSTGLAVILVGSLFGLIRRPAAFLPSALVLVGFELFFRLVYPGSYRHQALLLVWLIAAYWLASRGRGGAWPARWRIGERTTAVAAVGAALFVLLLALQLPNSLLLLQREVQGVPYSQSRNLGRLLVRERLQDATLMADPDVLLEPIPYYASNPIFLLRERKFGKVVRFTRHARTGLTLADLLADARTIRARSGRPVVILLHHLLDETAPHIADEGYLGTFSTTPASVRDFLASTRKLATLSPSVSDEIYDVYLLPVDGGAAPGIAGRAPGP